jgi:hypothetical protein
MLVANLMSNEALPTHEIGYYIQSCLEKIHSPDAFECFAKIHMMDGNKNIFLVSSYSVEFNTNTPMHWDHPLHWCEQDSTGIHII